MTDLEQIRNDILRQMYDEAEPGLDFDDVLDNPDEYERHWCLNHSLDRDRQQEIVAEHVKQYDLTQSEVTSIRMATVLALGPTTESNQTDAKSANITYSVKW